MLQRPSSRSTTSVIIGNREHNTTLAQSKPPSTLVTQVPIDMHQRKEKEATAATRNITDYHDYAYNYISPSSSSKCCEDRASIMASTRAAAKPSAALFHWTSLKGFRTLRHHVHHFIHLFSSILFSLPVHISRPLLLLLLLQELLPLFRVTRG